MKPKTLNTYKCRNCNKIVIKNSTQQNVKSWCDVTNTSTILFRYYDGALKTSASKERKASKLTYIPAIITPSPNIVLSEAAAKSYSKKPINKNFYGTISSTGASG